MCRRWISEELIDIICNKWIPNELFMKRYLQDPPLAYCSKINLSRFFYVNNISENCL